MKEQYYTIDGQKVGYKGAGGRKDYLTDNLGSVTSEVDQTGNNQTFIGRYKPYGGTQSSPGSSDSYQWVGSWGYRSTGLSGSSHYVRARHYSKISGNWTTIDRYWPDELAYSYAAQRPTRTTDPSGTFTGAPKDKQRKPGCSCDGKVLNVDKHDNHYACMKKLCAIYKERCSNIESLQNLCARSDLMDRQIEQCVFVMTKLDRCDKGDLFFR